MRHDVLNSLNGTVLADCSTITKSANGRWENEAIFIPWGQYLSCNPTLMRTSLLLLFAFGCFSVLSKDIVLEEHKVNLCALSVTDQAQYLIHHQHTFYRSDYGETRKVRSIAFNLMRQTLVQPLKPSASRSWSMRNKNSAL